MLALKWMKPFLFLLFMGQDRITVKASNFGPRANSGLVLLRSVASLRELCTKNEHKQISTCKVFLKLSIYSFFCRPRFETPKPFSENGSLKYRLGPKLEALTVGQVLGTRWTWNIRWITTSNRWMDSTRVLAYMESAWNHGLGGHRCRQGRRCWRLGPESIATDRSICPWRMSEAGLVEHKSPGK